VAVPSNKADGRAVAFRSLAGAGRLGSA